jgi:DNA-binding transcriptional ArsR family regulator
MKEKDAVAAFSALSQETRLAILRRLVREGRDGLPAGQIAEAVNVSPSNLSFHLKEMERAGLVEARREARSIIYSAAYEGLRDLIAYLMKDCCGGRPEICAPILNDPCCQPKKSGKRANA